MDEERRESDKRDTMTGKPIVPRAILPTLQEMGLSESDRLASLWERDAGNVQQQFADREAFMRRFAARENNAAD